MERPDNIAELIGRTPCCDKDWGGSHYHCANCGETSGMYGHYVPAKGGFICEPKAAL